jgi:hypothetical protein
MRTAVGGYSDRHGAAAIPVQHQECPDCHSRARGLLRGVEMAGDRQHDFYTREHPPWTVEAVYFLTRVLVISMPAVAIGSLFGRLWQWTLFGVAFATVGLILRSYAH